MQILKVMFVVGILACASACTAPQRVEQEAGDQEEFDESLGSFEEGLRKNLREVARDYVQAEDSTATIQGFTLTEITGNKWLVGVDTERSGQRDTIYVVAIRFYSVQGDSSYWRAEPFAGDQRLLLLWTVGQWVLDAVKYQY